jgi:hypothetical protein
MELLFFVLFGLIGLIFVVGAVVLLPLMLVGGLLKLTFVALTLPFRVVGALLGAVGALLGTVFGGLFSIVGLLVGVVGIVAALFMLPLLPLIALFGIIWFFSRSRREANA